METTPKQIYPMVSQNAACLSVDVFQILRGPGRHRSNGWYKGGDHRRNKASGLLASQVVAGCRRLAGFFWLEVTS